MGKTKARKEESREALAACRVEPGSTVDLSAIDPEGFGGPKDKKKVRELLDRSRETSEEWQQRFYASASCSVLVVFQAMDTGGKDGVTRSIFGPLNPQGVTVASFKRPTPEESSHDFLWRVHARCPAKGMIAVFNRSHYEDVLVPRVEGWVDKATIESRYRQINDFERHLAENGTHIVKFYLHISKDEQKRRLQARLDDREKHWKFEAGDLATRAKWDDYREAYESLFHATSTDYAPWHVIPANRKWHRDWLVAAILHDRLHKLPLPLPPAPPDLDKIVIE